MEQVGIVKVLEGFGRLADNVGNDALFETLTILNSLLAREVLENAKE